MKSEAVMYFGTENWAERRAQHADAREFVKGKQNNDRERNKTTVYALGVVALAVPPVIAWLERSGAGIGEKLANWVDILKGGVII